MQVLPSVGAGGRAVARLSRSGIRRCSSTPTRILQLGTAHLASFIKQYGALPRVLAAYNAGGSRVTRWSTKRRRRRSRGVRRANSVHRDARLRAHRAAEQAIYRSCTIGERLNPETDFQKTGQEQRVDAEDCTSNVLVLDELRRFIGAASDGRELNSASSARRPKKSACSLRTWRSLGIRRSQSHLERLYQKRRRIAPTHARTTSPAPAGIPTPSSSAAAGTDAPCTLR